MTILTRHIAREISKSTLLVLMCLMGLYVVFTFINEAGDVGVGRYSVFQAMLYVVMSLPSNMYFVMPMSALLGVFIGLGQLASQHEIVVMRTSGVSYGQMSRGVMIVAAVLVPTTFLLGAFISPFFSHQALMKKAFAEQGSGAVFFNSESIWLREDGDYIYIKKRTMEGHLEGVVKYHMSDYQLVGITRAVRARYVDNAWHLEDVEHMTLEEQRVTKAHQPQVVWEHLISPKLIGVVVSDPEKLTLPGLRAFINYRQQNGLDSNYYELTFWRIFLQPISTALLMLFAVPFVCGLMRTTSYGVRVMAGVLMSFSMYLLDQFFGPLSLIYNLPPLLGAAFPTLIFGVILGLSYLYGE